MATNVCLHADHLGSHSVSTDAVGALPAASGTLPADYGYTGQRFDSGDGWLYDYNARIYDQFIGRFTRADSIVPQAGNPQDFNRYGHAWNNPLQYTDPSGHCANESKEDGARDECSRYMDQLRREYGQEFEGDWYLFTAGQMGDLLNAYKMARGFLGAEGFRRAFHGTTIWRRNLAHGSCGTGLCGGVWQKQPNVLEGVIEIGNDAYDRGYVSIFNIAHELGHVWDFKNDRKYSSEMLGKTGGRFAPSNCSGSPPLNDCLGQDYHPGPGQAPFGSDARRGSYEDFAHAFALWVTRIHFQVSTDVRLTYSPPNSLTCESYCFRINGRVF